jgi:hypothetical protein
MVCTCLTEKLLICNSGEYDAASKRFHDLRGAFKGIQHLKYAQYRERVETGLKSDPRCFYRFANLSISKVFM